jgi:hypothetical protein
MFYLVIPIILKIGTFYHQNPFNSVLGTIIVWHARCTRHRISTGFISR